MTANGKSSNEKLTNQNSNKPSVLTPISGTALSYWSRQQKFATISVLTMLGLLLAVSAGSRQSRKPALVGVSSPAVASATLATTPLKTSAEAAATVAPATPAKKAHKKRPANVTYSDAISGVSFLYPRKALLTSGDKAQSSLSAVGDVPMNFVQPGGVAVATVALPDNSYPGTDFGSAFFNISVNRSVSEQECSHFAFVDARNADGEPVDAEKIKVGTAEMEKTSTFSANAIKQVETQYYHNFENGACYEYVLGLGTEGFGTEGGIKHVNRDEVFAELEKILATVKIDSARSSSVQQEVSEPAAGPIAMGKE
jgi:hypothetical protein